MEKQLQSKIKYLELCNDDLIKLQYGCDSNFAEIDSGEAEDQNVNVSKSTTEIEQTSHTFDVDYDDITLT